MFVIVVSHLKMCSETHWRQLRWKLKREMCKILKSRLWIIPNYLSRVKWNRVYLLKHRWFITDLWAWDLEIFSRVVRIFKFSDCWYKQGIICNALDSAENVRMNKSEVFVTVCKNENCRGLKNTRARFRGRTNIILLFQLLSRSLFFTFLQKR